MTDLLKMDTPAEKPSIEYHKNELLLMRDLINAIGNGFNLIGELRFNNETQRIVTYVLTRTLHSLMCAYRLSVSGYYSQAIALLRQLTESWLICKTCEDNPKLREYILTGKGRRPNFRELARSIGAEEIIYKGDFIFQSKFTHSSYLSLGILKERTTETLRVYPTYEETLFLTCAEIFIRNATLILECMYEYLYSINENIAKDWNNRTSDVAIKAGDWQRELRSKYG